MQHRQQCCHCGKGPRANSRLCPASACSSSSSSSTPEDGLADATIGFSPTAQAAAREVEEGQSLNSKAINSMLSVLVLFWFFFGFFVVAHQSFGPGSETIQ